MKVKLYARPVTRIIPRPLFPEHVSIRQMARIGWTAAERAEAERFLLALDNSTARLTTRAEKQGAA